MREHTYIYMQFASVMTVSYAAYHIPPFLYSYLYYQVEEDYASTYIHISNLPNMFRSFRQHATLLPSYTHTIK
jgi:hypothetical protein